MRILSVLALMAAAVFGQGGFGGPGRYEIFNVHSNKVLDLDRNDQTTVIQFEARGTDNQFWDIQQAGPNVFYIRNAMNGRALEFTRDSNSAQVVGSQPDGNPNQHWRIEAGPNGSALIISRFGKPLDIPDGSDRNGVKVQIYDRNEDQNQRFFFRRAGAGAGNVRPGGRFGGNTPNSVRNPRADAAGRYYDDRDQMWKLAGDGICFYRQTDFRGDALCTRSGEDVPDVVRAGGGSFQSLKFFGRARAVELFERPAFRGTPYPLTQDQSDLRRVRTPWSNRAGDFLGSFRVQ